MARIELNLSEKIAGEWRSFLATQPAGKLTEAGLLGDWVIQGFLMNVERYLVDGGPSGVTEPTEAERIDRHARKARRSLTKSQRRILPMFNENDQVTVAEISRVLGLPDDQGEVLVREWTAQGFLASSGSRDGLPTHTLAPSWQEINLFADRPSLNVPRTPYLSRAMDKPRK